MGQEVTEQGAVWYLAYATELHPDIWAKRLRDVNVLEKRSCQVPNAWLSFDVVGAPYICPCFSSCIIKDYNDPPGSGDLYNRQVWDRCCPGLPFPGQLPPYLEGVACLIPLPDFERISREFEATGCTMKVMSALTYEEGDLERRTGSIQVVLPVSLARRAPGLHPTLEYLRLSLLGGFLAPLSREMISHTFMIRQYEPPKRKAIGRVVTFLLMLPGFLQFLIFGRFNRNVDFLARFRLALAEKLARFIGSGWSNDDTVYKPAIQTYPMSGKGVIQSLSIPSHATRTKDGQSFVAYTISINTPTSSYSISHRYSDFEQLHQALRNEIGDKPPAELPPKHRLFRMSESQLVERRQALESYLKALLFARDPRWAATRAIRDFLAAPARATKDRADGEAWLSEHDELVSLVQKMRTTLSARANAPSHATHGMTREAKNDLVQLVKRSESLTNALGTLAKVGMTEGELDRRRKMLLKLQSEATNLGSQISSSADSSAVNLSGMAGGGGDDGGASSSSFVRPTSVKRVLGAPQETQATRSLDNSGVMQLQQQVMDDQDAQVDELLKSVRRQREMANLISEELETQDELLDSIDKKVDRVDRGMKRANKDMKKL